MNKDSSLWLETKMAAEELASASSAEMRDQISQYAGIFATHYLAIQYQTALEPDDYAMQKPISEGASETEIKLPPQSLFVLAVEAADAFLNGYVNPALLEKFVFGAYTDARPTLYPLAQMEAARPLHAESLNGIVRSTISLLSMSTILVSGIQNNGFVKSIPPEGRKLTRAIIDDSIQQFISARHGLNL